MREGYTHIDFLLDKSGSMNEIKADVIGGANAFIKDQQGEPGDCSMSLVQFDYQMGKPESSQDVMFDFVAIDKVPLLNDQNYIPRGGTPLLYAMIRRIQDLSKHIAEMDADDRPEKVIFVVYTDGEENQSQRFEDDANKPMFTTDELKKLIEAQEGQHGWIFTFLGADQDAFDAASSFGVGGIHTMSVGKTGIGTRHAFMSVSDNVKCARMSKGVADAAVAMSFSAEQRSVQDDELAKSGRTDIKNEVPTNG